MGWLTLSFGTGSHPATLNSPKHHTVHHVRGSDAEENGSDEDLPAAPLFEEHGNAQKRHRNTAWLARAVLRAAEQPLVPLFQIG